MTFESAPPAYEDPAKDQKAGSSASTEESAGAPSMPATRTYIPIESINTPLLSPEELECIREGAHIPAQAFGLLGILAAVFWFPFGIGVCLLDRRTKCKRCGKVISESCCNSVCE
ncbi:hypothetical protein DL96DRAFT_1602827 [Flagelloscypha sp. PMI_526]|nr:hypothetical protein DL96DRAFT_1602827 [Flagelloscypha sp. PMI_526]